MAVRDDEQPCRRAQPKDHEALLFFGVVFVVEHPRPRVVEHRLRFFEPHLVLGSVLLVLLLVPREPEPMSICYLDVSKRQAIVVRHDEDERGAVSPSASNTSRRGSRSDSRDGCEHARHSPSARKSSTVIATPITVTRAPNA